MIMKKSKSGHALLLTLGLICITATLLGAVFTITSAEARFMRYSTSRAQAIAYADGLLETMYDQWRVDFSKVQDSGTSSTTEPRTMGMTGNQLMNGISSNSPPIPAMVTQPSGYTPPSATIAVATPAPAVTAMVFTGTPPVLLADFTGALQPSMENGTPSRLRGRMLYQAEASVSFPAGGGTQTVTVKRMFTRSGQNIFDNFLLSSQPVTEIDPGALMTINGPVYAGGSLYIPTNNLNFLQGVTATGPISVGFAPTDPRPTQPNPPVASTPSWPANNPPQNGNPQSLLGIPMSALDSNFTDGVIYNDIDSDGNRNNNGFHEIVEMQVTPGTTSPDPLQTSTATGGAASDRLAMNADFRITIDVNNNVTIYKGSDPTNATANTTALTSSDPAYSTLMSAITTNTTLYDGRVGDFVRTVNVNVGVITAAVNTATSSGLATGFDVVHANNQPDGVLLYIQDTSAGTSVTTNGLGVNPTNGSLTYTTKSAGTGLNSTTTPTATPLSATSSGARGIRLVNGGSIPNVGMSIVSPNPIYIQGDFNTGSATNYSTTTGATATAKALTVSNQPPSDGGSAYPSPTSDPTEIASGYPTSSSSAKPAAMVAADAVTILSNSWADGNSGLGIGSRTPTNTTVNAAIVAGNVPSSTSNVTGQGTAPNAAPNAVIGYSGGIENFTRLLENWGSVNLTIHGSFALLYDSEQATQPWPNTGTVYNAPNRRWFYDSILESSNPPGFPAAYTFSRGRWVPHS